RWKTREEEGMCRAFGVAKALGLLPYWDVIVTSLSTGHIKLTELGRAVHSELFRQRRVRRFVRDLRGSEISWRWPSSLGLSGNGSNREGF
uniref:hypothetical protein n=1 Tax=Acetomicrobium sp. S15 = DSM 107314 TaxID=2529858 RepID=UPI0018E1204E